MANIWNLILAGIVWVIRTIVLPLFPDVGPAIQFSLPMVQGFSIFLQLSLVFFSIFNLWWFGLFLAVALIATFIRSILNVFGFIKNLIPWAIRLFIG